MLFENPQAAVDAKLKLRRELEASGTQAQSTVVEVVRRGQVQYGMRGNNRSILLESIDAKLLVEPHGEPQFEVSEEFHIEWMQIPWPGATVAVIFDPADHSRIVFDDSLAARQDAALKSEPTQPAGLSPERVKEEFALAHSREMEARLSALMPGAAAQRPAPGGPVPLPFPSPARPDPATELRKLADLHAAGVLTDEELAAERARVLDQI